MRILIFLAVSAAAWGQKPGAVDGKVSDQVTGAPVKKSLVTLVAEGDRTGYQAMSDAAGRFRIEGIKPGRYGFGAEAQGYVRDPARFEARPLVKVGEDETVRDLAIRLKPLGAIAGRVLDENGEPMAGAAVDGMRYTYTARGRTWFRVAAATTDDRGQFRLYELEAGRWYLRVNQGVTYAQAAGRVHRATPDMDYVETYYPGTTLVEEGVPIAVAAGAEVTQVEIRIRKTRTFRVKGKVVDGSGAAAVGAHVEIEGQGYVETHADGTFDARAIPPGRRRISAGLARNEAAMASGWQELVVADRDVEGVTLRMELLGSLSGTAAMEGRIKAEVMLEPLDGIGETERGTVGEDGTFLVPRVAAQPYRLTVGLPAGAYLKSARLGEQDVTESGRLDVTGGGARLALVLASDGGRLTGTVKAAATAERVLVTIAPAGRLAGRIDLLRSADVEDGRFEMKGVAPGEYLVWAWEVTDERLAESPEFRKVLESRATAVTVRAGEAQSLALTAITGAEAAEAREKLR